MFFITAFKRFFDCGYSHRSPGFRSSGAEWGRRYAVERKNEGWSVVTAVGVEDGKRFVGGNGSWMGGRLGLGGEVDVNGSGALGVALAQLEDAWE